MTTDKKTTLADLLADTVRQGTMDALAQTLGTRIALTVAAYECLKDEGFTEDQAFLLTRDFMNGGQPT